MIHVIEDDNLREIVPSVVAVPNLQVEHYPVEIKTNKLSSITPAGSHTPEYVPKFYLGCMCGWIHEGHSFQQGPYRIPHQHVSTFSQLEHERYVYDIWAQHHVAKLMRSNVTLYSDHVE